MAKKRGLHLEKTKAGYEVQDAKWNTLGCIEQNENTKQWKFNQGFGWLTASQLRRIATLVEGIKG